MVWIQTLTRSARFIVESAEIVLVTGLVGFALTSCKSQNQAVLSDASFEAESNVKQPQAVFDVWAQHIREETTGAEIQQDGCMPTHYPARGPTKGLIVLYHGFTACPQQFFAVSAELARRGYDVFLPLMPGQGRVPKPGLKEDYALPKDTLQVFRYYKLVERMNRLAKAGIGTKVVGGLSGGANLATGAAVEGVGLWNRVLLLAPQYKMAKAYGPITAILDRYAPDTATNYGEACRKDREMVGGRRGMCEVTAAAIRTSLDYGIIYRERVGQLKIPVQFVGADNDATVSNSMINRVFSDAKKQGLNGQLCFYKEGVPHSMMSRLENRSTKHWWMNSLEKDLVNFVVDGTWFPVDSQEKSVENKQNRCLIDD